MHSGKSYTLTEFLLWTRRSIFWLLIVACIPTLLYQALGLTWLSLPWTVIALLGTATAFMVGFKNVQTYNRTWEARQVWGACCSSSRAWGIMCRDFLKDPEQARTLVYRHFAWLTAMRYQLRSERAWETSNKSYNKEYKKFYTIPERETPLEKVMENYLSKEELPKIMSSKNKALQVMALQSETIKKLYEAGALDSLKFSDMHKALRDFVEHQGRNERIKNFPFPRQYATINTFFVRLFCLLLPFGMLQEFDKLNAQVGGYMHGKMVWLVIPFSILISWIYTSLEQVGESTENPFEGSANDIPISQMSRAVEIDLREMLGETDLPEALQPQNNIIL